MPEEADNSLFDILFNQSSQLMGLYDPVRQELIRINPFGSHLMGWDTGSDLATVGPQLLQQLPAGFQQTGPEAGPAPDPIRGKLDLLTSVGKLVQAQYIVDAVAWENRCHYLIRISETAEYQQHIARRNEAVLTHATIGILVTDQRGIIVSASRFTQQQLGYSEDELLGQPVELLVPDTYKAVHQTYREAYVVSPQVRAMGHGRDLYARRKDGSVFPAEISLSYFYQDENLYAVAFIIELTNLKETERQLRVQKERAEQLNAHLEQMVAERTHALTVTLHDLEQSKEELLQALTTERELGELKSRFVTMASHEFRTPLSTVLSSASLIHRYAEGDANEKILKHTRRIKASVNHLNDILEEFLSVGRLEEGKIEPAPRLFQLPELIEEVVGEMQGLLKAGQRIEVQLTGTMPIHSDPSLLRKIVVNLLSNAVKYSGEDTLIRIESTQHDRDLIIRVIDQGIGISDDDQKHLFERFFRAKNAVNLPGTGLGLHIVARYLELLRGTIQLTSQLQRGTTITITLPHAVHSDY